MGGSRALSGNAVAPEGLATGLLPRVATDRAFCHLVERVQRGAVLAQGVGTRDRWVDRHGKG